MSETIETVEPPKGTPVGALSSGIDKKGDKKRTQKRVPRDKACYNCGEVSFSRAVSRSQSLRDLTLHPRLGTLLESARMIELKETIARRLIRRVRNTVVASIVESE